jgi:hypothetical protein
MQGPRYPNIRVKLTGHDGNAFAVIGAVSKALRAHGVGVSEREEFTTAATAGDYDNVLRVCGDWVEVS